jgi:hypothetical protein
MSDQNDIYCTVQIWDEFTRKRIALALEGGIHFLVYSSSSSWNEVELVSIFKLKYSYIQNSQNLAF